MQLISGKIPVKVNPFFWLLIFFIALINSTTIPTLIVWMGVIFFSVLIHEYGHALTAVMFHHRARIELFAMGGMTHRQGPPLKLWQEFLIVLNGPLAGVSLCIVALWFRTRMSEESTTLLAYALDITVIINLFWTVVNLLPIHPLDGGQLLRIVMEGIFGFRGVKIALFLSFMLSAFISMMLILVKAFLPGALFFLLTFESYRTWRGAMSMTKEDRNFELQNLMKEAEMELRSNHFEQAYDLFQKVRQTGKRGILYQSATESLARILVEWRSYQEAYELLQEEKGHLSPAALQLLHISTFHLEKWKEAIEIGNRSYQYFPSYETAVINAICHSILGEVKPALGWLNTAVQEGLPNLSEIVQKREFDTIRHDPQFISFLKTIEK